MLKRLLLLALMLPFAAAQGATYCTDFGEYSAGAATATGDFTERVNDATFPWTLEIVSGGGASGNTLVNDVVTVGTGAGFTWDVPGNQTGDMEVLYRLKINAANFGTDEWTFLPGLYYEVATDKIYMFRYTGSGNWRGAWVNTSSGSIGGHIGSNITGLFTPSDDTYFYLRLAITDTATTQKLKANVGATLAAVDPATWDLDAATSEIGEGYVGFSQRYDDENAPFTVDFIGVGTGGDEAPSTCGGGGTTQIRALQNLSGGFGPHESQELNGVIQHD